MLIVHRLGQGGHRYYLQAVGPDPARVGEAPGVWSGGGAARLGLAGEVTAADFRRVLPTGPNRVPAFDLTFAAPKSVSVLHGLGDGAVVAATARAHDAAVGAGLAYLERYACVVRADGEQHAAEGFVAAAFRHRVSRADDPHLHTHVVVANQSVVDERWRALHAPLLYGERQAAGAVYHLVLRYELARSIGVEWAPATRGRADVIDVPDELRRRFSQRSAAVRAEVGMDPSRQHWAERVTRPERDGLVPYEALVARWQTRAEGWAPTPGVPYEPHRDALPEPPDTDRWTRADVLVALADRWSAGAPAPAVAAACDAITGRADVVRLGRSGTPGHAVDRFTTEQARQRRREALETVMRSPTPASVSDLDELRQARGPALLLIAPDDRAASTAAARTGARAVTVGAAAAHVQQGTVEVAVVLRPERADSRELSALVGAARSAGVTVHGGVDQPSSRASSAPAAGALVTVPLHTGDLTVAGSGLVAASAAVADAVDARSRGVAAMVVAPANEVDALLALAREEGYRRGDLVWFTAAHSSAGIARHDVGTVVAAGCGRVRVQLTPARVVDLAADAPSMRPALVVPPLPSVYARADELFAVGVSVRHTRVHHYIAVDLPVGVAPHPRLRVATGAALAAEAGAVARTQRRARSAAAWADDAERRLSRAATPVARAAWSAQLAAARASVPTDLADGDVLHHQIRLRRAALEVAEAFGGSPERSRRRVLDRRAELALAI